MRISDWSSDVCSSDLNVEILREATCGLALTPIKTVAGGKSAYWTWLIRLTGRDAVMRALKAQSVQCSKLHYPNHHYTGFGVRSEEHTSELQSLMRISYAVFCLKKKNNKNRMKVQSRVIIHT